MPPGIQRSRAEYLLQVLPTGMNELGVGADLIYLARGAVAPHIRLFENLVEGGVLIYAMDDVAKNFLFPLGPTRLTPKEELPQQGVLLGHRCPSSTLRSSTKTSIHPLSALGGDVRVNRNYLSPRVPLDYSFEDLSSGLEDLLSHGFDEPASLIAIGELLLGGREHVEAANDHQIVDYPGSYPLGTASHEPVLEGHHLVADGRLGFALPTRRWGVHLFCAPPPGVLQRRRPVPHRTS